MGIMFRVWAKQFYIVQNVMQITWPWTSLLPRNDSRVPESQPKKYLFFRFPNVLWGAPPHPPCWKTILASLSTLISLPISAGFLSACSVTACCSLGRLNIRSQGALCLLLALSGNFFPQVTLVLVGLYTNDIFSVSQTSHLTLHIPSFCFIFLP